MPGASAAEDLSQQSPEGHQVAEKDNKEGGLLLYKSHSPETSVTLP